MSARKFLVSVVSMFGLLYCGSAAADKVDELIESFRLEEEMQAQHRECLDNSSKSVEADLRDYLESGELGIEAGDEDWALLIAIYAEYYNAFCDYLAGDAILNFYRAEFRKRFTPAEIDALIEFNATPIGKKLNDQWFEMNRAYGELVSEQQLDDSRAAQTRFEERMEKFWEYREDKLNRESREQDA